MRHAAAAANDVMRRFESTINQTLSSPNIEAPSFAEFLEKNPIMALKVQHILMTLQDMHNEPSNK